ncbi:hypothetical protein ACXWRS_11335, partial [Streptococcus pyogenes]
MAYSSRSLSSPSLLSPPFPFFLSPFSPPSPPLSLPPSLPLFLFPLPFPLFLFSSLSFPSSSSLSSFPPFPSSS